MCEFRGKNQMSGRDEVVHLMRCYVVFNHFACPAPFPLLFVYFTFSQPGTLIHS